MTFNFSIPQGSTSGTNLFNIYSSTLSNVVPKDHKLNGFADDHSISDKFYPKKHGEEDNVIKRLQTTPAEVKDWMKKVRLKMNDSKMEFMYFGSNHLLKKTKVQKININGIDVQKSECVRLLGAWLDSSLSFKNHIKKKASSAMANFYKLKQIRSYLTKEACETLVLSLCISHIDYGNALLYGLPNKTIDVLQRVQNMCAKLVLK